MDLDDEICNFEIGVIINKNTDKPIRAVTHVPNEKEAQIHYNKIMKSATKYPNIKVYIKDLDKNAIIISYDSETDNC